MSKLLHNNVKSDLMLLSLAGDNAHITVDGGIIIGPGISKPAGHLTEKNIIIGSNTTVNSLPLLDVQSDDVQASHGASIDKLSESDLFYLRAKGLTREQSSHLMIEWYIDSILAEFRDHDQQVDTIKDDILRYILS